MLIDYSLLQAALEGLGLKLARIDEQIAQVKHVISGKPAQPKKAHTVATETSESGPPNKKPSKRRNFTPESRQRIAAAQKARWAKLRGEA